MTQKNFDSIPFIKYFIDMGKQNEPFETFSSAFTVIGLVIQGKMDEAEKELRRMDTSSREHLINALEAAGLV